MEKRKKIILCFAQIGILVMFLFFALSCASQRDAANAAKVMRAGLQGGYCGANGFVYVGDYSDCPSACERKGYSYYCEGQDSNACFCK